MASKRQAFEVIAEIEERYSRMAFSVSGGSGYQYGHLMFLLERWRFKKLGDVSRIAVIESYIAERRRVWTGVRVVVEHSIVEEMMLGAGMRPVPRIHKVRDVDGGVVVLSRV